MVKQRHFIGITGSQGVGKSTFCRALYDSVRSQTQNTVELLSDLGAQVRSRGIPVGINSNIDTIAAVFTAHLTRERTSSASIVILDRCLVDALAYTRALDITSQAYTSLFEEIFKTKTSILSLVIHLELSSTFSRHNANHETQELRQSIDSIIPSVINENGLNYISMDAAQGDAITRATKEILAL